MVVDDDVLDNGRSYCRAVATNSITPTKVKLSHDYNPALTSLSPHLPWSTLRSVSSITSYQENVWTDYCCEVNDALRTALVTSTITQHPQLVANYPQRSNNFLCRYNPKLIRDIVWFGFDWIDICRHYDDMMEYRKANQHRTLLDDDSSNHSENNKNYYDSSMKKAIKSTTTQLKATNPLRFVVSSELLLDPTIIPYAMYQHVVETLLEVLEHVALSPSFVNQQKQRRNYQQQLLRKQCGSRDIIDSKSSNLLAYEWSSSQFIVLNAISELVQRSRYCFSSRSLSDTVVMKRCCVEHNVARQSCSMDDLDMVMEGYRFQFAMWKQLEDMFPHHGMVVTMLGLMWITQHIDTWDLHLLLRSTMRADNNFDTGGIHDGEGQNDDEIIIMDKKKKRRRTREKCATVGQLHGEVVVDEDETLIQQHRPRFGCDYNTMSRQLWSHGGNRQVAVVTIKDVVKTNPINNHQQNQAQQSLITCYSRTIEALQFTRIPLKAVMLRSECYKTLVRRCSLIASPKLNTSRMIRPLCFDRIIRWVWQLHQHCGFSSAGRLCLVLVTDQLSQSCDDTAAKPSEQQYQNHNVEKAGLDMLVERLIIPVTALLAAGGVACMGDFNDPTFLFAEWACRMYTEILVDCHHFDSKHICWKALQPLVQAIQCMMDSQFSTSHNDDKNYSCHVDQNQSFDEIPRRIQSDNDGPRSYKTLPSPLQVMTLRCLACILSKRHHVLLSTHSLDRHPEERIIYQQAKAFISSLSISYGQEHYWIPSHIIPGSREYENTLHTLQVLGIIGLCRSSEIGNDDTSDEIGDSEQRCDESQMNAMTWPFAEPDTLRCAYRRMGPKACSRQLLSCSDDVDDESDQSGGKEGKDKYFRNYTSLPSGLDRIFPSVYLNNDICGIIFSYLGYKRLLWLRQVCKTWKTIADQNFLWFAAYKSRFHPVEIVPEQTDLAKLHDSETALPELTCICWKDHFRNKFLAERRIRFLRHKATGWKVRTCGYVGCLDVLKSPKHLESHYASHERQRVGQKRRFLGVAASAKQNRKKLKQE